MIQHINYVQSYVLPMSVKVLKYIQIWPRKPLHQCNLNPIQCKLSLQHTPPSVLHDIRTRSFLNYVKYIKTFLKIIESVNKHGVLRLLQIR